jgi:hypothetical protein
MELNPDLRALIDTIVLDLQAVVSDADTALKKATKDSDDEDEDEDEGKGDQ